MTGKRHLAGRSKNPEFAVMPLFWRQDERRFLIVEFVSYILHVLRAQATRIRNHRQLIATEKAAGEYVAGKKLNVHRMP